MTMSSFDNFLHEILSTTKTEQHARPHPRVLENFQLIWLDTNLDDHRDEEYQTTIEQFREVVNTVDTFNRLEACLEFLFDIKDEKVFLIISGSLGQQVIPTIHHLSQLHSIYIFCANRTKHEQWITSWTKIKGVFTQIRPICDALKQSIKEFEKNSISLSFVPANQVTNENLDQLDQLFIYTQVLKEILFEIQYTDRAIKDLVVYCRQQYTGNNNELQIIDGFETNYRRKTPIWWYTYPCFIHSMLNRALRTSEIDTIIRMGFFIQDLHRQIEKLHGEQTDGEGKRPFTVYRGQGLSKEDFEKVIRTKGGLMSFNNFLSTSKKRKVSLEFAEDALNNLEMIGVLFKMVIDPSNLSTPYAMIDNTSYFNNEQEILFSMHTIFRIGEIKSIENHSRLFQVELKMTSVRNQQVLTLIERLRLETAGSTGWYRLGMLLIKLGRFDKAEQVYSTLLDSSSDDQDKEFLYHQLGLIKRNQADYSTALEFYRKAIQLHQTTSEQDPMRLATLYNNIGQVYENMGEYHKALTFYDKSLEIYQTVSSDDHSSIAISFNNIGLTYRHMGDYGKALLSHQKALEIEEKSLPENHPSLATSYKNLGLVYKCIGEYSKALESLEKALAIEQTTLPTHHPSLAISYNNIGLLYEDMGEYSKALSFYEKTLEIHQKVLPNNHPDLATAYNNIGSVYMNLGEYSKALWFHEKTLEIEKKVLPADHPSLATTYSNIGIVYNHMGNHTAALSHHQKALEIRQKIFPDSHQMLAISYSNIGSVYDAMSDYKEALSFYEKALAIEEKILPANHPDLATSYNNIGIVHDHMNDYEKASFYHQKALDIYEKTLSSHHPDLANSYHNLARVYQKLHNYTAAISYYEKALTIQQTILPANHPDLTSCYKNLCALYNVVGEKNKANLCHKQSLIATDSSRPSTETYKTIDLIYDNRNGPLKPSISIQPMMKTFCNSDRSLYNRMKNFRLKLENRTKRK